MKLTLIFITIIINFFNPLLINSQEKNDPAKSKSENTSKEKLLNKKSKINAIHIVNVGDTMLSISKLYSVDKNLIIKINNLKDENYIYVGQNLIISNSDQNSIEHSTAKNKEPKGYHIVQVGENLTEISNKYKLNLDYLIDINNLNNPDSIKVGKKLLLNKNNSINTESSAKFKDNSTNELINIYKKTYGPIVIQSKRFKKVKGRKVFNALNSRNKELILSIRCETKELDVRFPGKKWKGWKYAQKDFEKDLINDICQTFN